MTYGFGLPSDKYSIYLMFTLSFRYSPCYLSESVKMLLRGLGSFLFIAASSLRT